MVILDGKVGSLIHMLSFFTPIGLTVYLKDTDTERLLLQYIRGGPVVGFVYWAPEYHFLVFFNRLRLED